MNTKQLTIDDVFREFKLPLTDERKKLILKAYTFAKAAHANQKRQSGEDYIQHVLATAKNLAEIGMGSKTIAAGLLHDVPEDTSVTLAEIKNAFSEEIVTMVDGITKLGKIKLRGSREEYFLENLRKMFIAMAADIRVIIIKLADRLHNMETLDHLSPEKQVRIARETMDVFVPVANRLGIGEIKQRLEDLSFKYLDPPSYHLVKGLIDQYYKEQEVYINLAIKELRKALVSDGIKVMDINGRAKNLFSLFQKLKRYDMDITRIYDLAAVRIIVPEIADCYETLGIVHKKYRPMVGRIKDYISLPKPNGYQSIHTTVFGPKGKILEIQIRTQQMHDESEFGIAAHWIYSEKQQKNWRSYFFKNNKSKVPENEIAWVKQLREWQNDVGNENFEEFMEVLKIDFFKNHIFAFTPKGDIIELPEEATAVDFAYAIHSDIGDRTTGAKADGRIIPLDSQIKNGQVIEILTVKDRKNPSKDWLSFVKTSVARSHIRRKLRKSGGLIK